MNEEAIFAAAIDKKTAVERRAFLDQACAGNAELRAHVEALLRADADAGSFLENPPVAIDATVASGETARSAADSGAWISRLSFLQPCDKAGSLGKLSGKVGEYEIMEIVGHGGMGAVLRAFDTKLSRVVAVKVMAPELAANPVAVKRFLREATTAAAVHHDHVVTIHAVDDSHQPPYLVMQFVEGQTLQEKIDREGALELKHILRIGSQAAAGLAAAHKTGLIHRDVKPSNILLENGVERVKISDFGLARAADDVNVTQTGIIAGTPQYMSPEQAKGEPIDARGDLFSLGSVLYAMCTGRPAFRADNPIAVLRRVIDDAPRPIREINAEIPEWLCEIVEKLLEKRPEVRFQSAQEVGELLAQHLAHLQQPASCPMPPRLAVAKSVTAEDKNWLASEIRLYRATAIMSLVAFVLTVMVATFARGEWPTPLAGWFFWGGIISLFLALAILFAAQRAETRQSYDWAIAAACLSLLPINPFLIFCIPVTLWSLFTVLRASGQSRLALAGELKKPPAAASSGEVAHPAAPFWVWGGGLVFAIIALFGFVVKETGLISGRALGISLVILIASWLVALTTWLFAKHRQYTRGSREYGPVAKPSKLTARGVFIEHPVLGVVAVLMLIASASVATFMLTAVVFRRLTSELVSTPATASKPDILQTPKTTPGNPVEFSSTAIGVDLASWGKFIDPRSDCRLERTSDSVTITVPGGPPHNLLPMAGYNHDAPRLIEEMEGDFTVQVAIPPYELANSGTSARGNGVSYRSAALLVWADADNLLRFERSSFGERGDGAPFLHLEWYVDGRQAGEEFDNVDSAPGGLSYVQIERRGRELHLSKSDDGQSWANWKTVRNINLSPKLSVGVAVQNSTTRDFQASFKHLIVGDSKATKKKETKSEVD